MSDNPFSAPVDGVPYAGDTLDDDELFLADRGTRFIARLADNFMTFLAFLPGYAIIICLGGDNTESSDIAALVGLVLAVVGFFGFLVYQWYLISTKGQTVGKQMMKIKIVKMDGSAVDFVSGVIMRDWLLGVPSQFIPFLGLIDALMIFGDQRRCLHDMIASTKVVVDTGVWDDDDVVY